MADRAGDAEAQPAQPVTIRILERRRKQAGSDILLTIAVYEKCSCPDESKRGIRSVMKEVRDAIVKILEGVTVAQLCDRVRLLQGRHDNPLDYII